MSKTKDIEIRSTAGAPTANAESRRIEGYAIVFNSESQLLDDWGTPFVETIEPDAVTDELLRAADVKCVFNHTPSLLLARSKKGEGTLTLEKDEKGLRYSFDAPNTVDGDKVLELVRRGDLTGSSFAFSARGEDAVSYYEDADGLLHRTVHHITGLYDVSPVIDPAYAETSVEAKRALEATDPEGEGKTPTPDSQDPEDPTLSSRVAETGRAKERLRNL